MSLPMASRPEAKDPKMSATRTSRIFSSSRDRICATWLSRRRRSRMLATRSLAGSTDQSRRLPRRLLVRAPA